MFTSEKQILSIITHVACIRLGKVIINVVTDVRHTAMSEHGNATFSLVMTV